MARTGKARPPADRVAVKRLAADGGFTYREISQRTGLPLGTVLRYSRELIRSGDIPARRPPKEIE